MSKPIYLDLNNVGKVIEMNSDGDVLNPFQFRFQLTTSQLDDYNDALADFQAINTKLNGFLAKYRVS